MGEVWKALDQQQGTWVALKWMLPALERLGASLASLIKPLLQATT